MGNYVCMNQSCLIYSYAEDEVEFVVSFYFVLKYGF